MLVQAPTAAASERVKIRRDLDRYAGKAAKRAAAREALKAKRAAAKAAKAGNLEKDLAEMWSFLDGEDGGFVCVFAKDCRGDLCTCDRDRASAEPY